jgi:hypothetical protein
MFLQHLKLKNKNYGLLQCDATKLSTEEPVASILRVENTSTTNILAGGEFCTRQNYMNMYVNN